MRVTQQIYLGPFVEYQIEDFLYTRELQKAIENALTANYGREPPP